MVCESDGSIVKSFAITESQVERVIGAVIADEAARRFNYHFDFLTIASWSSDTSFGGTGLDLSEEKKSACLVRVAELFGLAPHTLGGGSLDNFGDVARIVSSSILAQLTEMAFKSAARGANDSNYTHHADTLFQDAAAAANVLYGRRRLLSFVAPHSLIGFVLTVLMPNLQGIESIDARGMTPDRLSETLAYGDVLVATPTLWRYMVRENLTSPDNTMAVSFGEAMAPELAAEMRQSGFGVLRELYGSTETGLMGWRDAPTESFVLFDHWSHEGNDAIRMLPNGESVAVPAVDFMEWEGSRAFKLAGRRDGAVQVGAVNVFPDDVARQLCRHPVVEDCAVRVSRRNDGATRLVAHIVLKDQTAPSERVVRDIDAWSRTSLRQQERPRIYHFHKSLAEQK